MKTKSLKSIILASITLLIVLPVFSQKGIEDGSKYGKGEDSINCIKSLSLYKEFFKHNNYKDAINSWRQVFGECPAASEKMYVEGVTMYKSFIESGPAPQRTEEMIDTLMLIYDRRMMYFPGQDGSILGRKGIDLLRYRRTDIRAVEQGYNILKKSIEMEKSESRDAVLVTFMNASITLNKADKIDNNQVIEDYFMVTTIIDKLLAKSSQWESAKQSVDDLMLKSGLLTCDALNTYFEPQYAIKKGDQVFLEKLISFYSQSGCDRTDLYVTASEQLYLIEPGPKSAHQLARLFMVRNEYSKASKYLLEAVQGTDIDSQTKAEWYFELAFVTRAQEKYCEALNYAREAVALKSDYGQAYILIGDCYILSRTNLGDDFQQRTAYWAAADKYAKAKAVDPSVSAEATKRIEDYSTQYPNNEEVFFRDLKDGDSFEVKGCINEYTTVRSIK